MGLTYHGGTSSSVAVQRDDKFPIRYNPDHPDQNNSLASVCDRPWFNDYLYVVGALILGATLYGFVNAHLLHR
jgi:hypothetical protein